MTTFKTLALASLLATFAGCAAPTADEPTEDPADLSEDALTLLPNLLVNGDFEHNDNVDAPSRISPDNPLYRWTVETTSSANGGGEFGFKKAGGSDALLIAGGPAVGLNVAQVVRGTPREAYVMKFQAGTNDGSDSPQRVTLKFLRSNKTTIAYRDVFITSGKFPNAYSTKMNSPADTAYVMVEISAPKNPDRHDRSYTLYDNLSVRRVKP